MNPQQPIIPSAINPQGIPATDPAKIGEERRQIVDQIQWLERLTANEDFQRYVDFVNQGKEDSFRKGSDIDGRDPEQRNAYMQRYAGLKAMVEWAPKELDGNKAALKELDEKQRKV